MVTFEQVYRLAEQLPLAEQLRLIAQLREKLNRSSGSVTREQLLAEFERKKVAGVFENSESLYGKYKNPAVDVSEEELNEYLIQVGREWEEEMDELMTMTTVEDYYLIDTNVIY
jgi:hypothetical protein